MVHISRNSFNKSHVDNKIKTRTLISETSVRMGKLIVSCMMKMLYNFHEFKQNLSCITKGHVNIKLL